MSSKKRSKKPARGRPRPSGAPHPVGDPLAAILTAARDPGLFPSPRPPASPTRPTPGPAPAPALPPSTDAGPRAGQDEVAGQPLLHGIAATFGFDTRDPDPPRSVRFTARPLDNPQTPAVAVEKVVALPDLPRDAGPVTVTARLHPVAEGTWQVEATPEGQRRPARSPVVLGEVRARLHPLVHGPGVLPFAWPGLVLTGVVLALGLQRWLLNRHDPELTGRALAVSLVATVVGFLSAKAWYMRLHRVALAGFPSAGTCIQGFLLGAAGSALVAGAAGGLPIGLLADVTAPGVLLAMALGRVGCWAGGCCAGRATSSRWGLVSSDRCVRVRRVPVQLLEGAAAAVVGTLLLVADLTLDLTPRGVAALVAFGGYTAVRQLLFPLRAEARRTSWGRRTVLAGSVLVSTGGLVALLA